VQAPAITGDPVFERYFRVQQNTLEQLIATIPALWIFGLTWSPLWAAAIGLLFVVSRGFYAYGYIQTAGGRHYGYLVGAVATVALVLGALFGVLRNLYLSAMVSG
jgi:glutathione S-transferase